MELRLTANAGLVAGFADGRTVLIDALHTGGARFSPVSSASAERVMHTEAQCLLVTHTHADHYDEGLVRQYLLAHRDCVFVGPAEVAGVPADRQRILHAESGRTAAAGIDILYARLIHEGEEYRGVANYGYAVRSGGESVVVLGDTAIAETARALSRLTEDGPATVAALNFPVFALSRGRAVLKGVKAEALAGIHLPFAADDREGYRKSAHRALSRVRTETGLPAVLLEEDGQSAHFG